jgi:hypothetical protein
MRRYDLGRGRLPGDVPRVAALCCILLACNATAKRELSQYLDLTGTPAAPRSARVARPPAADADAAAADITSPTTGGGQPHGPAGHHIGHALRAPSFEGPYGLEAAHNLSLFRSELFAKNAVQFLAKAQKVEDDGEKYSRYKMYAPFITCPPGGWHVEGAARRSRRLAACCRHSPSSGEAISSSRLQRKPRPQPLRPAQPGPCAAQR